MKSYRFVALLLLLSLICSLCSCSELHFHTGNNNDPHDIHDQHNQTNQSNQGGSTPNEENDGAEGKITYVYSVISKTLHLPDCYHTNRMNKDYKFTYTGDISVLLEKGFTICKDCLVPDDEKEDEEPDEEENLIAKEDATYATNKVSLVVHLLDCYMLDAMIEQNLRYTDLSYEELLELNYRPCGTCMPEEYKEFKKNHPELFEK